MSSESQSLLELQQIRSIMERSSRFISLSGFSGIAAGTCALAGAAVAMPYVHSGQARQLYAPGRTPYGPRGLQSQGWWGTVVESELFQIALATFVAAFLSAFLFTWLKSKRQGIAIWGPASYRLMANVTIPMVAGGVFCLKLMETGNFGLLAPTTLIFYGLALLNASKYTFPEIRYLGLAMMVLGFINCWNTGYGIYFWAFGFGVLHICYGAYMWYAYERKVATV